MVCPKCMLPATILIAFHSAVSRIQLRICSGFSSVCGPRNAKMMTRQPKQKRRNFSILKSWMFSLKGWIRLLEHGRPSERHKEEINCTLIIWFYPIFGRQNPEAEFLDVMVTTVLRVFLLAIHSHLYNGLCPEPQRNCTVRS